MTLAPATGNGGDRRLPAGAALGRMAREGRRIERDARLGGGEGRAGGSGKAAPAGPQATLVRHPCAYSAGREAGKSRRTRGRMGSAPRRNPPEYLAARLFQYLRLLISFSLFHLE